MRSVHGIHSAPSFRITVFREHVLILCPGLESMNTEVAIHACHDSLSPHLSLLPAHLRHRMQALLDELKELEILVIGEVLAVSEPSCPHTGGSHGPASVGSAPLAGPATLSDGRTPALGMRSGACNCPSPWPRASKGKRDIGIHCITFKGIEEEE